MSGGAQEDEHFVH